MVKKLFPLLLFFLGCFDSTPELTEKEWTAELLVGFQLTLKHSTQVERYRFGPHGWAKVEIGTKSYHIWPIIMKEITAPIACEYEINQKKELIIYKNSKDFKKIFLKKIQGNKYFVESNGKDEVFLRTKE